MIVVFSLMRRRAAIDVAAFNRHWLDPHGTLVCRFPRLRRYSQNRILASPATSPAAQRLQLDGIAELAYDTDADQEAATQSPAMAACDRDFPAFIGAVVRIVAEAREIVPPPHQAGLPKLITLFPPAAVAARPPGYDDAIRQADGVVGWIRNATIRQRGPNSAMPVLEFPVAEIDELWFHSMAALERSAAELGPVCGDAVARYAIEELRLI